MWQLCCHTSVVAVFLLTITTLAAVTLPSPTDEEPRLQQLHGSVSCECVEAIYTVGNLQFNLTSEVQEDAPSSLWTEAGTSTHIVSTVSFLRLDRKDEKPLVLSQLLVPGRYLHERMIDDIEHRVIHAAKDMLEVTRSTVTGLPLDHIVKLYDTMIESLASQIGQPNKFSQGRVSIFYHISIANAALRLANGTHPDKACPPHQAYEHKGLFACQQEYSVHVQRVLLSPFFACRDHNCVKHLQHDLGKSIVAQTIGMTVPQAVKTVENLLVLSNNSKLAEDIARILACGNTTCDEPGCSMFIYDEGWHIFGADWGCCGDYRGCCFLATEVCLVHDAICTCCSFPTFCLDPFCHPDPWCSLFSTTTSPPLR